MDVENKKTFEPVIKRNVPPMSIFNCYLFYITISKGKLWRLRYVFTLFDEVWLCVARRT